MAAATQPAAGAPGAGRMAPLQEFRTPRNAGWFYTPNPAEAASAVPKAAGYTVDGPLRWVRP